MDAPTAQPTGSTWPGSPAWSTTVSLTEIRSNVVFTFYLTAILILAKTFKKCAHRNDKSDSPVLAVADQMAILDEYRPAYAGYKGQPGNHLCWINKNLVKV